VVHGEVVTVLVDVLKPADSPRLQGENHGHAVALAESGVEFPPILVHRSTMRVIDGMHRLFASRLRGRETIAVRFFEGDERDVFMLAVKANIEHGLPLSLSDRKAAAGRIVRSHPQYSDRAIAEISGISARTVAIIRECTTAGSEQLHNRVGRDGRVRPANPAVGRQVVSQLLSSRPHASLRAIAREAGVSPGTVRKVREQLAQGSNPPDPVVKKDAPTVEKGGVETLQQLRRDPSLRSSQDGRLLLHLLAVLSVDAKRWEQLARNVPGHHRDTVAAAANRSAEVWRNFIALLAGSTRSSTPG
jgi:ParB-like chromosome segregation protein Spo0J